jgi:hypothetical protein
MSAHARCRNCACRLDGRNETGYCRTCWIRRPLAARFGVAALDQFLNEVPVPLLMRALSRRCPDLVRTDDVLDVE